MQDIVKVLNTGDYEMVTRIVADLAANENDARFYHQQMVIDRNEARISKLINYFDDGGAVVNVGVAHLPGEKGLIKLLRDRGFKIEPIQLPAAPPP